MCVSAPRSESTKFTKLFIVAFVYWSSNIPVASLFTFCVKLLSDCRYGVHLWTEWSSCGSTLFAVWGLRTLSSLKDMVEFSLITKFCLTAAFAQFMGRLKPSAVVIPRWTLAIPCSFSHFTSPNVGRWQLAKIHFTYQDLTVRMFWFRTEHDNLISSPRR